MKLAAVLIICTFVIIGLPMFAQVSDITNHSLPDVRRVQPHPLDAGMSRYSSVNCLQTGAACGVFKNHEYGHQMMYPRSHPPAREQLDECQTVGNDKYADAMTVYQLFLLGDINWNRHIDLNPQRPIASIRNCALQAEK